MRREPRHPGAQLTFEDIDGQRFTAFVTDQPDEDLAELDRLMRAHAGVEDRIRDQMEWTVHDRRLTSELTSATRIDE